MAKTTKQTKSTTKSRAAARDSQAAENSGPVELEYTKIIIERDPMTKIPKTVPPWHVPVYRAQFGDGAVEIVGLEVVKLDQMPTAREEQEFMRQAFGADEDNKQSRVDFVYGTGMTGRDRIQEAIDASAEIGDPEAAQYLADGDKDPDDETLELRHSKYIDPSTGETVEFLDDIVADNSYQAKPGNPATSHRVVIESNTPITVPEIEQQNVTVTASDANAVGPNTAAGKQAAAVKAEQNSKK